MFLYTTVQLTAAGRKTLREGQKVTMEVTQGSKRPAS